jgi:sugar diacid utilization regulator
VLVESPDELSEVGPGDLAVFTAHASAAAHGYRLDVALREAGERGAVGIVLHGVERVSTSAERLGERGQVAVIATAGPRTVSDLLLSLDRLLRDDARLYLDRAASVIGVVDEERDVPSLLATAGRELGTSLITGPVATTGSAAAAPVQVDGQTIELVLAGRSDPAIRLALPVIAAAVARLRAIEQQIRSAPTRSRSESMVELLLADSSRLTAAAERARLLGVPIDSDHMVACVGFDRALAVTSDGLAARLAADDATGRVMMTAVAETGPVWTSCRLEDTVVLVWSRPHSRRRDTDRAAKALTKALRLVQELHPDVGVFCGLGSSHGGVDGLRASAAEAKATMVSARSLGQRANLAVFDAARVRRFMLEMVASPAALAAITSVLEPLETLIPDKRTEAIETLNAYLDAQGSYTAAGKRLQLHPNAVLYRMKRLTTLLDLDLGDPDQRLAVHLACRARMVATPGDAGSVPAAGVDASPAAAATGDARPTLPAPLGRSR